MSAPFLLFVLILSLSSNEKQKTKKQVGMSDTIKSNETLLFLDNPLAEGVGYYFAQRIRGMIQTILLVNNQCQHLI